MGRGNSNLLGPLVSANRSKKAEKTKKPKKKGASRSASSLLFAPLQKSDDDLYAPLPTKAALARARGIAQDALKGDLMPLLLALDKQDKYKPGKSPAIDLIFEKVFSKEVDRVLRANKLSKRDPKVKAEKAALDREAVAILAQKANDVLHSGLPGDEQIKKMEHCLTVDKSLLAEASLRSSDTGPIRTVLLGQIATTPLEDADPEVISSLLERRAPREAKDIFHEIIRRQIVAQIKRNLPYTATSSRNLSYGMLRSSSKKPAMIHLIEDRGSKTVCGKWGARNYRLEYGDWTDGVKSGDYKRCPKCEKGAPEDLTLRVEAEHADRAADLLSRERQEELSRLAEDPGVKRIVRKALREGKPMYEASEEVDRYLLGRVAKITARAADEAVEEKESRGKVVGTGGGHILWDSVSHDLGKKIKEAGYEDYSSVFARRRKSEKQDDPLLHLVSAKDRQRALTYKMKGNETSDYERSEAWFAKSEELLARSIRRTLRQERASKAEGKGPQALF